MMVNTLIKLVSTICNKTGKQIAFHNSELQGCLLYRSVFAAIRNYSASASVNLRNAGSKRKTNIDDKIGTSDKSKIILSLNFKSPEDAQPFYDLPVNTLLYIQKVTLNDQRNGFCKNRLYYVSSKIQCPPVVLSPKLARRTFVYSLSFDWLEKSLNELLEKGVSGDRIIRDLWVLKYHHNTIKGRLESVKKMGIDNLYPWMVRCSPHILERYMNISKETKSILGDNESTQMYLANRLNITKEDVEDICFKIPALKTIRVTKVKKFLDFLMEEGYDAEEIASKPRILASSLKTVMLRLNELHRLGIEHVNLNVLCRSRKDYKRYRDSLSGDSITRNT